MQENVDTIAAISTSLGESGIGIVRLSGPLSVQITKKIFKNSKKSKPVFNHRKIYHGYIVNSFHKPKEEAIDEVLVTVMRAPKSYTREDVIEINCHGGIISLKRILELVLSNGARMAEPGEFTKRAFINGRIDLVQAEAVADIISAKTELSLKAGIKHLKGVFSGKIAEIQNELIEVIALLEANIDFPDDEIPLIKYKQMSNRCKRLLGNIDMMLKTADEGKILKEGLHVAIAGKPNVGKSSLLNVLLEEERAIVTDIPGTTRDTIEEMINIKGVPVKLIDTAGIRKTKNAIESKGVFLSKKAIERADVVLFVLDSCRPITMEDKVIFDELKQKKSIVVINKIDLTPVIYMNKIKQKFHPQNIIKISCLKRINIEQLKSKIVNAVLSSGIKDIESVVISNIRHKYALEEAETFLRNALIGLNNRISEECIALDCRGALDKLGAITGKVTSDDILDEIFSKFCIGK